MMLDTKRLSEYSKRSYESEIEAASEWAARNGSLHLMTGDGWFLTVNEDTGIASVHQFERSSDGMLVKECNESFSLEVSKLDAGRLQLELFIRIADELTESDALSSDSIFKMVSELNDLKSVYGQNAWVEVVQEALSRVPPSLKHKDLTQEGFEERERRFQEWCMSKRPSAMNIRDKAISSLREGVITSTLDALHEHLEFLIAQGLAQESAEVTMVSVEDLNGYVTDLKRFWPVIESKVFEDMVGAVALALELSFERHSNKQSEV